MPERNDLRMRIRLKMSILCACAVTASTVVCSGQTGSFTSQSIADAFVTTGANGSLSSSNFGAAGALAIAASGLPEGEFQSVLKFDLSGAFNSFNSQFGAGQWMVRSVTLDLTASSHGNSIFNPVAAGSFNVSLMQNNSWVEGTGTGGVPTSDGITFNSLEGVYINNTADQALGTFAFTGNTSGQNGYGLTLSSGLASDVTGGDVLSLRLFAADSQISYLMTSRNGGTLALEPALVVDVIAVPEPRVATMYIAALGVLWLFQLSHRWRGRARPED